MEIHCCLLLCLRNSGSHHAIVVLEGVLELKIEASLLNIVASTLFVYTTQESHNPILFVETNCSLTGAEKEVTPRKGEAMARHAALRKG